MRKRAILPAECAQACQHLSLRADGELSEFESVLLEAHLAVCPDCQSFEKGVTGFTTLLRAVAPEQPIVSFKLPRGRSRANALLATSLRAGSAAAALAIVVLTGFATFHSALHNSPSAPQGGANLGETRLVLDLHERQLQQLDSLGRARKLVVPHGLAAAERDGRR
jgi:predicted anti-sigma-YlaC factor YlaD